MAITQVIPEVWSARWLMDLYRAFTWREAVTDYTADLARGNKLHIGRLSDPTIGDYTVGTAIPAPTALTDTKETLTLDKQKYFNFMVDDIDERQAQPNVSNEGLRRASIQMMKTVDDDIFTTYKTGIPSGSMVSIAAPKDDLSDVKATRATLAQAVRKAIKVMDDKEWPVDQRYMRVPTKVKYYLIEYLADVGIDGGNLGSAGSVFQDGKLSSYFGLNVRTTTSIPNSETSGDVQVAFGLNSAIAFAMQIDSFEAYRPESFFADAFKGLQTYGSARVQDDHQYAIVAT